MNDDRLGPYRLLRRLGEGGMGVVHLAVDPQGRQVAVKVLRAEVAGDEVARRRLSREVETMRRVRSKYIAEVLDADVTGHRPYIVTRYVPGRPLDEIIKDDGPLDLPALVKIAHGVATALAAVHSVGVIHRDLKPGNILILDGDPVLIDFGIAQAVDATRLTQTGMFIGTPGYLAPEIIEGQEAGPEVDIHAWAGTLLYAGTGQPPFGKGTLEMIFYNITAGKADVSAAPAALQPLLKAAFQRNPAKRPKAAELAEQTARMLPQPLSNVPDEISTVPRPDRPEPSGPQSLADKPAYDISTPPMTPRQLVDGHDGRFTPPPPSLTPPQSLLNQGLNQGPVNQGPLNQGPLNQGPPVSDQQRPAQPGPGQGQGQGPPDQPYISLLHEQSGGDPWPTRRVTPEELRQVQRESGPSQPWQVPQQVNDHGHQPLSPEADVPTRRVRPETSESPDVPTRRVRPDSPESLDVPTRHVRPDTPESLDVPTRRVRPDLPDYGRGNPPQPAQRPVQQPPPPYIPAQPQYPPDPRTQREPFIPGVRPGQTLQRSRAYGVAGAMLLIIMIVAAVLAPILVAVVAIPVAMLLRAADLAQTDLNARRPTGAAALDVVRVFAHPQALAKSAGITLALVLYALILGLPVTLLLTVVLGTDPYNALAWGAAVALWTICAGPGVEGPGRQMRRTLSSLVPSRTGAMVLAGVLAAVAALSLVFAYGTFGDNARRAVWTPLDVGPVVQQLNGLKGDTGG